MNKFLFVCLTSVLMFHSCIKWTDATNEEQAQAFDIKTFVHQIFIHGVDYEQASKYGVEAAPTLIEMLNDRKEEPYWSNIVVTLCIVGDERAVNPVLDFISKDLEAASPETQYNNKTNAIMALGYLINKTGNQRALKYLIDSLDPSIWSERGFKWMSPFHSNVEERNIHLSTIAIIGLGLSGSKEAHEALRSLQSPAPSESARRYRERIRSVVIEALNANEMIANNGLAEYYRQSKQWRM